MGDLGLALERMSIRKDGIRIDSGFVSKKTLLDRSYVWRLAEPVDRASGNFIRFPQLDLQLIAIQGQAFLPNALYSKQCMITALVHAQPISCHIVCPPNLASLSIYCPKTLRSSARQVSKVLSNLSLFNLLLPTTASHPPRIQRQA